METQASLRKSTVYKQSPIKICHGSFSDYKKKAFQISAGELIKIEANLHELLSHTNTLLLNLDQHSETLLEVFPEVVLDSLHLSLINKFDSRFEKADTDQEAQALNQVAKNHCCCRKERSKQR